MIPQLLSAEAQAYLATLPEAEREPLFYELLAWIDARLGDTPQPYDANDTAILDWIVEQVEPPDAE